MGGGRRPGWRRVLNGSGKGKLENKIKKENVLFCHKFAYGKELKEKVKIGSPTLICHKFAYGRDFGEKK